MSTVHRRTFLSNAGKATGLGLSATLWSRRALGASARVRIGFIGVGSRGSALLRLTAKVADVEVGRLCDVNMQNLRDATAEVAHYRAPAASSLGVGAEWREVVDDKSLDAVVIATPDYLHAPLALNVLEAGKAVYCEKPIAYTIQECFDLVAAVNASKAVFQSGYQLRYSELYRNARAAVAGGKIGTVTFVRSQHHCIGNLRRSVREPAKDRDVNWHLYRERSTGLMGILGSHRIDVANWFLDAAPDSVVAVGGIDWYCDNRETEDNVAAVFSYRDGVRLALSIVLTNAMDGPNDLFLGTGGAVEVSPFSGGYVYQDWACNQCYRFDAQQLLNASDIIPGSPPYRLCHTEAEDGHMSLRGGSGGGDMERARRAPPGETLEALKSFVECCRTGTRPEADVTAGCDAAVAALMANIAVGEERVVRLSEWTDRR